MKKITTITTIISLCFIITSCQSAQKTDARQSEKSQITKEEQEDISEKVKQENQIIVEENNKIKENAEIDITFKEEEKEEKDENGNLLLTITTSFPTVTIKGNTKASDNINAYYDQNKEKLQEKAKQYIAYAKDDLSTRDKERLTYWNGYALGETYSKVRVDDEVISMVQQNYEFLGGAHPNTTHEAQNFDTQTGNLLTLKDVVTNEDEAKQFIYDYILKLTKQSGEEMWYFEGYEDDIKDLLTDQTWYLSEEGFVVIGNVYIILPYAAGIQEYVIPYAEFPYLLEKYQMK